MERVFAVLRRVTTGKRSAWVTLVVVGLASGAFIGLSGDAKVRNDPTATLPQSAQSTEVARLQKQFPSGEQQAAIVVFSREDRALSDTDQAAITERAGALRAIAVDGNVAPTQFSPDRKIAFVAVNVATDLSFEQIGDVVEQTRTVAKSDLPTGLTAQVTGGPAFTADIADAFKGANITLLLATVGVVALLLLITYRSPILWLIPLLVVAVADQVTAGVLAVLSRHTSLAIDDSTTGIVEVLVFGAGTDYALLLIARYREELRRHDDRREAMREALRNAGPAIAASGSTVVLALLTLFFAILGNDKALGVSGAAGIAIALAFALVVLPAALVSCPRAVFWPLIPRNDEKGHESNRNEGKTWRRIGNATTKRPGKIIGATVLLLLLLSTGTATTSLGLSQTDTFRTKAESVDGLATLARAFPAGSADPTVVLTNTPQAETVRAAVERVPGVASIRTSDTNGTLTQLSAVLTSEPNTPESFNTIERIRTAVRGIPDADALVGGTDATNLDSKNAALRDLKVIAPLILLVVFLVLIVLLRALVAPVILMITVVLTYFGALGGASLIFTYVVDYPGIGYEVPLLAFLFLVALGVDYNIFLVTRAKEEAARTTTRDGVVDALAVTGGVITSAGILLAAVFAVLGVLPVTVLTQLGIIVCLGVLLDALLVRTILVPAIVQMLGDRFWLPGHIRRAR